MISLAWSALTLVPESTVSACSQSQEYAPRIRGAAAAEGTVCARGPSWYQVPVANITSGQQTPLRFTELARGTLRTHTSVASSLTLVSVSRLAL